MAAAGRSSRRRYGNPSALPAPPPTMQRRQTKPNVGPPASQYRPAQLLTARTRGRSGRPARACGTAPSPTPVGRARAGERELAPAARTLHVAAAADQGPCGAIASLLLPLSAPAAAAHRSHSRPSSSTACNPAPADKSRLPHLAIHWLQLLQAGDDKHRGLAHARLGLADHVHAQDGLRDALVLHCKRRGGGAQGCRSG